ncbi:MAG TPA: UbiA family prenyltransferase [Candidatus Acidoferrum sp.]|nr:UbiA family prenyltransferase [Candidatus Acidoferrum sp.]
MDVRNLKAFIRLIRLPYWLMEGILCVLFMITFQRGFYRPVLMGLAVLTMAFVGAGGAAINDYFNRDSDAITHPDRPIPSQQISPARALQFSALTFLAGLGVSIVINPVVLGIVWLNVILFTLYPHFIKRLSGFLSNLVMGYLGASIALFAEAVVAQTISISSLSFVGMIAGGSVGFNVLKDVLTLDGDVKVGYYTLAATRGISIAAIVGAVFLFLSVLTSPLPYLLGVVSVVYLFPVVVWGSAVVYSAVGLLKKPTAQNVKKQLKMFTTAAVVYPVALIMNIIL